MTVCISLLRGINVGGKNSVKMPALAGLYRSLGFSDVQTYLQSGNVVFRTETDMEKPAGLISEKISQSLGLDVTVILRTADEWSQLAAANPFLREADIDAGKLHVTFLAGLPPEAALARLTETVNASDRFIIRGREIYLYCPGGYGRTRFSNGYFEKNTGLPATTRNWRTVLNLERLAVSLA